MKRLSLAGLIALLLSIGCFSMALAHADLISSTPANGTTLETPPETISLTFDEELGQAESSFTVTNAAGEVVGTGTLDLNNLDRTTLAGTLNGAGEAGVYTVAWVAYTPDDQETKEGTITFTIAVPPTAAPTAAPTATPIAAPTAAPTTASTAEATATIVPTTTPGPTAMSVNSPISPNGPTPTANDDGSTVGRMIALGVAAIMIISLTAAVVFTRRRGGRP